MVKTLRGLVDLLFGYDFFISYSHGDGVDYPRELSEQLESSGFRVFLDSRVYVAGDDLQIATRRRVRMSNKLVVVIGARALHSQWVLREVQECLEAKRVPIAIDIGALLSEAPEDNEVKRLLQDKLYVAEDFAEGDHKPSAATLQGLIRSFRATRQDTRRLRMVSAAALLLALVATMAVWQSNVAEQRRKEALVQQQLAQSRALAANAEAQLAIDPEVSVLLALESLAVDQTSEADQALRHALPNLFAELTLAGHNAMVQTARYSPDGAYILTAGFDGTARIWKEDGGIALVVLHGHEQAVTDAAFSADGQGQQSLHGGCARRHHTR